STTVRRTSLRQGYGGPPKLQRRRKADTTLLENTSVVRLSNRTGGSHVVSGFSRTEVHTMKSIWRFVRVAVITAAATAAIFAQQRDQPISLKAMGSFYVGGERTEIKHSGGV